MRTIIKLLFFFFAFSISSQIEAQVKFQKEYSIGINQPCVIDTLIDGYLIAGSTIENSAGGLDGFVMKVDFEGNKIWSKVYGGVNDDQFISMRRMQNGNFILAGYTKSFIKSSSDPGNIYLVVIDISGNVIKSNSIGSTNNKDIAYCIKETTDKGFIIAGTIESLEIVNTYLIKVDSSLNVEWSQEYSNASYNFNSVKAVVQTQDGGYAFTGYSHNTQIPDNNALFIVKADAFGVPVNSKHFNFNETLEFSTFNAYANDIIINKAGNIVVVGSVGGVHIGAQQEIYKTLFLELKNNFQIVNSKAYVINSGICGIRSVQQTPDGGYIIGGHMGNYYLLMFKTDASTKTQWAYYYAENYNPKGIAYSVKNTNDGGYILSGSLISGNIRIVKTPPNGLSGCSESVPVGPGVISKDITLGTNIVPWTVYNNIDSTLAVTSSNDIEISIVDVCNITDVKEPDKSSLIIYPNPCTNSLIVEVNHINEISIFNYLGELVQSHKLNKYNNDKIDLDISMLLPGFYFLRAGEGVVKFIKE